MRMVPISSRRSTATGGRRAMVMTVMSSISRCSASRRGSVATTWCASVVSALGQRVHGVDDHLLGDTAHFGDAALDRVELLVEGLEGMFDQGF